MAKHSEFIHGTCQQLLFSPKGGIEGALVKVKGTVVQVPVPPDKGAALAQVTGPGRQLRVLAVPDHSPKTAEGAHPVFKFESFADDRSQPASQCRPLRRTSVRLTPGTVFKAAEPPR